ncbi:hypothetical protein EKO04_003900 [Ascochyta lentis]|uniref:Uncharacterized protein n=1 Tax=Ascochyta lentis TaxID=205686 RepID=A0A8H7MKT8_9PLEO|nr:hypothetical protein EKO04_003900 [Ascochyta lentis]
MDGVQQAKGFATDEIWFGVTNTALFFLGIALLEIAYWQPIKEKMTDADEDTESSLRVGLCETEALHLVLSITESLKKVSSATSILEMK